MWSIEPTAGKCGAIFHAQREAVKMFWTRFYFVFYLAASAEDRKSVV